MARLVAHLITPRIEGYFHTGEPIILFTGVKDLTNNFDKIPQMQPLPIALLRKFSGDPLPKFKGPIVKSFHPGSGFDIQFLYVRSQLDDDLLGQVKCPNCAREINSNTIYCLWTPEDRQMDTYSADTKITDELTRWLRGGVGWISGPKPYAFVSDVLNEFKPKLRRTVLTPEMLQR